MSNLGLSVLEASDVGRRTIGNSRSRMSGVATWVTTKEIFSKHHFARCFLEESSLEAELNGRPFFENEAELDV
jgi:hypothetical protein